MFNSGGKTPGNIQTISYTLEERPIFSRSQGLLAGGKKRPWHRLVTWSTNISISFLNPFAYLCVFCFSNMGCASVSMFDKAGVRYGPSAGRFYFSVCRTSRGTSKYSRLCSARRVLLITHRALKDCNFYRFTSGTLLERGGAAQVPGSLAAVADCWTGGAWERTNPTKGRQLALHTQASWCFVL